MEKKEVFGPISAVCDENTNEFVVYPNPNQGNFTVEIHSSEGMKGAVLQLMDMTGKIILENELEIPAGTTQLFIENSKQVSAGTYVLRLMNNSHYFEPVKIVVK